MAKTQQILPLTSVRFFAAFFVALFHVEYVWLKDMYFLDGAFRNVLKSGFSSVGFFFILSGFVLALNYGEKGPFKLRKYYVARFARIYPVYFFSLLLGLPSAIAFLFSNHGQAPLPILAGESFLHNALLLTAWIPEYAFWNYPGWSLSAETFFYALFPILIVTYKRLSLAQAVLGIVAILAGAHLYIMLGVPVSGAGVQESFFWYPPLRVGQFLSGILLAKVYVQATPPKFVSRLWFLPIVCALLVFVLSILPGHLRHYLNIGLIDTFSITIIYSLATTSLPNTRFLSWPKLVLLGEASYALYILHVPVRDLLRGAQNRMPHFEWSNILFFTIYVTLVLTLSILTHRFIEVPARARINKWLIKS